MLLEEEAMQSKQYMTANKLSSSRMVRMALCSGDALGEGLVLWRCQQRLLCLHKTLTMYTLESTMSPTRTASRKAASTQSTYLKKSLKGRREQDLVTSIRVCEVPLGVATMEFMNPLMDVQKVHRERKQHVLWRKDVCLNFDKQALLGLRTMAWRMLRWHVAQMEKLLISLYKEITDLHVKSSPKLWDPKMSVAMTAMVSSITTWLRAKSPVIKSVGLCLGSRENVTTRKSRRMVLAEIPKAISEKKAFLMPLLSYRRSFLFILLGKETRRAHLKAKQEKSFITYCCLHQSQPTLLPSWKHMDQSQCTLTCLLMFSRSHPRSLFSHHFLVTAGFRFPRLLPQ